MALTIFRRRMSLKRRGLFLFIVVFLICYIFGVFTHLLELDFEEFEKNSNYELDLAVQALELNPTQNLDYYNDINQLNFKFMHISEKTCGISSLYLIIIVKSKYSHFEQRNAIRQTWGLNRNHNLVIRTVFLIGSSTQEYNSLINEEAHKYDDIIQQNFFDTYYNNTLKTLMALKWINKFCSNSKFYLLIDDDFYLSRFILIHSKSITLEIFFN